MSEAARVERLALTLTLAASGVAIAIGVGGALEVSAEHRLISGTGGMALTLLVSSLACSPAAALLASKRAAVAVALRRARRWLGLASAGAALVHATLGAYGYLGGIDVDAIFAVAWMRQGALALLVLGALSLTSFPRVTRALHVRAWSALHRGAYLAGLLAGLHATGAPFGDVGGGVFALVVVVALLVTRPVARAFAARRTETPPPGS